MNVSVFFSVVASLVAMVSAAFAFMAWQEAQRWRGRVETLEASMAGLRREIELVASISVKTGRRVQRVENHYSDVAERVDVVESRGPATTGSSLEQAIEWARRGADTDKLSAQFGLSAAEAELVARLHGKQKRA